VTSKTHFYFYYNYYLFTCSESCVCNCAYSYVLRRNRLFCLELHSGGWTGW